MNGGDPVIGGNQVTPGGTRPVTPGPQPAGVNTAAASNSSTDLTIPHDSPAPAAPTPMAPAAPSAPAADADFSSLHSEPVSSPTPPVVPTPSSPTSTASLVNPLASTPVTPPQSPSPLGMSTPNITSGSSSAAPAGMGPGAPMPSAPMQNNFGQGPLTQSGFSQNPFSGGVYTPPVYSQSGDIILGGDTTTPPKKSKAKAVLAVLAILIVVAGVVWAVVSSFGGLMGGSNSTQEVANESLNKYFNYLLFETDSNQPISGDTIWSEEKILKNLPSSDNNNPDYFNKLSSLYDAYYNEFSESEESSSDPNDFSSLQAAVDNNKFALDTLLLFSTKPSLSSTDITKMFFSDGKDNTIAYVTNYYQDFINSSSGLLNSYGETAIKLADLTVTQIEEYSKINCIQNNAILESCTSSANLPDKINSINEEIPLYLLELSTSEYNIASNVIDDSRAIYLEYTKEGQND